MQALAPGVSASDPYPLYEYEPFPAFTNPTGRTEVARASLSGSVGVLVLTGQSNAACHGAGTYVPSNTNIYNFNIYNGGLYSAAEPMLGCSGLLAGSTNASCFATRLADKYRTAGVYNNVVLVPIAIAGTKFSHWIPGGLLNHRIMTAARRMAWAGFTPTFILQAEGEQDELEGTDATTVKNNCRSIVQTWRNVGVTSAPYFIALSTRTSARDAGRTAAVRSGLVQAVDHTLGIYQGPDTDTLDATYRYDDCHFNNSGANGLDTVATMWKTVLDAYP